MDDNTNQATGMGQELATAAPYIETASATTNPDNKDSGNTAYLITFIGLAALIALAIAFSRGLATLLGAQLYDDYGYETSGQGEGVSLEELERLLSEGAGNGQDSQGTSSQGDDLSQSDALGQPLALYDTAVDDEVSATAYAGVPSDVRTYVRNLLTADRDAADGLARYLNTAARGDDASGNVKNAVEAAASGKAAIEGVEVPDLDDQDVADALAQARQDTLDRWDAISAEVRLLDTDGTISLDDLKDADDAVVDKTSDAAQAFESALGASASR